VSDVVRTNAIVDLHRQREIVPVRFTLRVIVVALQVNAVPLAVVLEPVRVPALVPSLRPLQWLQLITTLEVLVV
jgi:hypothetical protein